MEAVEPVVQQLLAGSGKMNLDEFERYQSPLKDFYRGKTVFLTGGTGFLGKLYVEKLIRCGVSEILLLSRAKKGKTPYERLASILSTEPIFTTYHSNPEHYHERIKIIDGDISKSQLSISNDDLAYVVNNANIFFHAAADVRFDESLKESVETNVRGTLEVLKVAVQAKALDVFVYISTAFSNCTRRVVEEKFYSPQVDPYLLIKLVETDQDGENFEVLARKIIEPWPNTYAFTKALAEDLVRQFAEKIPVAVIRPSIVTTTSNDPIPGWTDNLYGFNGVVVGGATGALRIFHINNDFRADIIPADIVMNATLAVAWYAKNHPDETNIINCTAADNPVTWGMARTELMKWKDKMPFMNSLWIPTYTTTRYYVLSEILKIFYHVIPAILFDLGLCLSRQKPKVMKLYRKVHKFSEVLSFFTNNEWDFRNEQFHKVLAQMSEEDQRYFPCDAKRIDWTEFLGHNLMGLRMYVMKEKWDNLEQAKARYQKRWIAHMVFRAIFYAVMGYLLYKLVLAVGLKDIS